MLGHSGEADSAAYLRNLCDRDPERRGYIAMALAEHPEGENWDVLVRSLPIVEGVFAQQVLMKLAIGRSQAGRARSRCGRRFSAG